MRRSLHLVDILIVDDKEENLRLLSNVLNFPGYNLVTASSGREALKKLLEHDFALVLLDVVMPDLDGFTLAEAIRGRERSQDTPIIFLTAFRTDLRDLYRGYQAGAVDYLEKPLDADIVRAKVAVFADLHRKKVTLAEQARIIAEQQDLERRREQLEASRKLQSLQEAIPQIVWTASREGAMLSVNHHWAELGIPPAEALGAGWLRAVHPGELPQVEAQWRTGAAGSVPFQLTFRFAQRGGGYRWYLCRSLPEYNSRGEFSQWLGTFTDIDDQKRLEQERAVLLEQAQQAIEMRDEFISVAAHELSTPLTTVQLQLELTLKHAQSKLPEHPWVADDLKKALRQNARLGGLLNNLLDVSRVESGNLGLNLEPVALHELVHEVAERFEDLYKERGVTLTKQVHAQIEGTWDKQRLEQVIGNLLSNALKYGGKAPVSIELRADAAQAQITVRDEGPGIPESKIPLIFTKYARGGATSHEPGLGLGLYIVRQLIEAHGGTIALESAEGRGCRFTICLPLDASAVLPPASAAPPTAPIPSVP